MQVSYLSRVSIILITPIFISGLLTSTAFGNGTTPYKVEMKRINPSKPIRQSSIMSKVRKKFPGRILSIRKNPTGGPDCHIIKSVSKDGEFRVIHVACK